jgi:hypothetical protein
MKGATWHKLTVKRLSFTVIILLIAVVIVCSWERNPLITSLPLSSDQFKSIPKGIHFMILILDPSVTPLEQDVTV